MFERKKLIKLIDLQEKSYLLLRWINSGLMQGGVNFTRMHESMSMAEAAQEWITRNRQNLPDDLRPEQEDIPAFGHLLSSYLSTSYEVAERRVVSHCGCYCDLCTYLIAGQHLKPRTPSKKARREAHALKLLALRKIVEEQKAPLLEDDLEKLCSESPEMSDALAWAAYGNELMRRSEFSSQGAGVLVLWRDIAWDGQHIRPRFKLKPELFIRAEERIKARLNEMIAAQMA